MHSPRARDYQKAAYLYARTLLSELKVPLIVSLREEWYWHFNRGGGPRTAFHDFVYHIPCPLARDVIAKRLEYAVELVSKQHIPHPTFDLHRITVKADSMMKYLSVLKKALIDSEELGSFYECFANRSIRRGLDVFLDFVRSGDTETDVYLKALIHEGSYKIAFHSSSNLLPGAITRTTANPTPECQTCSNWREGFTAAFSPFECSSLSLRSAKISECPWRWLYRTICAR